MFNFFKKILGGSKKFEQKEVSLVELSSWFEEIVLPKENELNQYIAKSKQELDNAVELTRQSLLKLQNTKLINPDIPERAKHFAVGNREAYIKKISLFADAIKVPDENFNEFFVLIDCKFGDLLKSVARPYQILNEFFSNEVRAININISNIEKHYGNLKKYLTERGLHHLDDVRNLIRELETKHLLEKDFEQSIAKTEQEIKTLEARKLKNEQDIELLKKNKELRELKTNLVLLLPTIKQRREQMMESFSIIHPALKKYERIALQNTKLLQSYLASPIDALLQDLRLHIVAIIPKIKDYLELGKIELKDKKKQKVIKELEKMDKNYLGSFLTEFGQLQVEKRKIEKAIEESTVIKVIVDKEKQIQKIKIDLSDLYIKKKYTEKEFEKLHIDFLTEEIADKIKTITEVELIITI